MDVSAYSLVMPAADGGMWTVNTLHGTARWVSEDEHVLLRGGARDGGPDRRRYQTLIEDLVANHIVETDPGSDRALYDALLQAARAPEKDRTALRLGFMLDHMTTDDFDAAADFVNRALGEEISNTAKQFIYGWHFTEAGRDRLRDFATLAARLPSPAGGPSKRHLLLHTDGRAPLTDEAMAALESLDLPRSSCLVVFMLNQQAAEALGGSDAYAQRIFEQQSQLFALGFMPNFVLRCTADSIDFMLDEMFEALCFSGVYPRSITAALSKSDAVSELGCELAGWDWSLYENQGTSLAASEDLALLEPLGRGLADQLRSLLRVGDEVPITRQCPFARRSFLFGAQGAIAPCPVMLARAGNGEAATPAVSFGTTADDRHDRKTVDRWSARGPETIAKCGDCAVAPICGSGCPLEAIDRHGSMDNAPCPPIDTILDQESRAARPDGPGSSSPFAPALDTERHAKQ